MRRLILSAAAFITLALGSVAAANAVEGPDPRIPGGCYVWSHGGWLGGSCPDGMDPWFPDHAQPVTRYGGADRYEAAAAFSAGEFAPGVPTVYVASGLAYADALAAGAATDGPVLLVPPTGPLPDAVAAELARLDPARIVVVGGPASVPDGMVTQVRVAALR